MYLAGCTYVDGKCNTTGKTYKGEQQFAFILVGDSECLRVRHNTMDEDGWVLSQFVLLHRVIYNRNFPR